GELSGRRFLGLASGGLWSRGLRRGGGGRFDVHVAGRLVLAQADEGGMAQVAVRGGLGEGGFGDEIGRDPPGATRYVARRVLEGRGLAREPVEQRLQFAGAPCIEPGADAAAIGQLAVLPGAEKERGEALLLVGGTPAANDEFLAQDAFD